MRLTNRLNLPDALVRAVAAVSDEYDRGDAEFTVTELIAPPRIPALKLLHDDEIVVDVADLVYAAEGTAFHTLMERSERMGMAEKRMYLEFEGTRISGKFDLLHLNDVGLLQDWKRTSVYAVTKGAKWEWTAQLNLLDFILSGNGLHVTDLEIVPVFRDWLKSRARRDKEYPQTQSIRLPVERWPAAQKESFLRERIALHRGARAGTLPMCTDEERWTKGAEFAVKKTGAKNAMRGGVFKQAAHGAEAQDLANALAATTPGAYVEARPGERTRCLDWCPVATWCPEWQTEIKEMGNAS